MTKKRESYDISEWRRALLKYEANISNYIFERLNDWREKGYPPAQTFFISGIERDVAKFVEEERRDLDKAHNLDKLREAVNLATKYVGCGDTSCLFVKTKGMGTNGGCSCLDRYNKPGIKPALANLYKIALATVENKP